jgi:hypothetical protein
MADFVSRRTTIHSPFIRQYSGMTYPALITDFLHDAQLPRFSAKDPVPDQRLIQRISAVEDHEITIQRSLEARCIRGLLLVAAGGVEQAHRIVQGIPTIDGSYIHGIVHRIEGDFDNARYWFRRAGTHPAAVEMYRRAVGNSPTVASRPTWDASLVTDMVETSWAAGVTEELRAILTIEFEVLLQFLWTTKEQGSLV